MAHIASELRAPSSFKMTKESGRQSGPASSTSTALRLVLSPASTATRSTSRLGAFYGHIVSKLVPTIPATGTPSLSISPDRAKSAVPIRPPVNATQLCLYTASNSATSLMTIDIDGLNDDDILHYATPGNASTSTASTPSLTSGTSSPRWTASSWEPQTPPKFEVSSTSIDHLVFGHSPITLSMELRPLEAGVSAVRADSDIPIGSTGRFPSTIPSSGVDAVAQRVPEGSSKAVLNVSRGGCYGLDSVPWSVSPLVTSTHQHPSPSPSTTLSDLEAGFGSSFAAANNTFDGLDSFRVDKRGRPCIALLDSLPSAFSISSLDIPGCRRIGNNDHGAPPRGNDDIA
ncbi:hypothetical protein LXA43DRAFT_1000486 [Ganoderma leucocontextum]|nr:hypothetical protein LXA43DRAFT_1000486 [Ganoderma leucocontextum]